MNDLVSQLIWNFTDIRGDQWFLEISIELSDYLNYHNLCLEFADLWKYRFFRKSPN
ncbi:unnamed protein product [marine sediment metagenome]|uniref:Uncharacterized protein n=1 Tax=marine sediment metagenome TaxID=412755 RepID=X0YD01_9ZZZZ